MNPASLVEGRLPGNRARHLSISFRVTGLWPHGNRISVNKSAARDEKVDALFVSAKGEEHVQLTSATDLKGGRVHLVAETGHVGAFFGDPKVAHGHIVYTAPHVLNSRVPFGTVELNTRALARGVKGEVAPWSDCAQRAYVLYEVALGLGPGLVRDRNREIGLGFGLWLGLPPTALSRQSRRSLAYSRPSTPYRRSRACSAAGTH